jgi:hypothetical protein
MVIELTGSQKQKALNDPTGNSALTTQPAIYLVTPLLVILYGRPACFISLFNCFFSAANVVWRQMAERLCWMDYNVKASVSGRF